MFNIGFGELVLIGVIALVFIGPKQIPEVARVLGNFIRDIKRASNELQKQITLPSESVEKIKSDLTSRVQKVLDEKKDDPDGGAEESGENNNG